MKSIVAILLLLAGVALAQAPTIHQDLFDKTPREISLLKAIGADPDSAEANFRIGEYYTRGQQYEEAARFLKKAIQINPANAEAYFYLALNYDQIDQETEAIQAYKQATEINPDYFVAYYDMGLTLRELRRYEEVILAFREAARCDPEDAYVYLQMALSYYYLGDRRGAKKCVNTAVRMRPDITRGPVDCVLGEEIFELLNIAKTESIKSINITSNA